MLQRIHFKIIEVFPLYLYKLAVQVRFLPFFEPCHVPTVRAKSLWSVRTNHQLQIPHPFYQSLGVYKIPPELE